MNHSLFVYISDEQYDKEPITLTRFDLYHNIKTMPLRTVFIGRSGNYTTFIVNRDSLKWFSLTGTLHEYVRHTWSFVTMMDKQSGHHLVVQH